MGTGTYGTHNETLTVYYTDGTSTSFTQGFSDWMGNGTTQTGESIARTMSYYNNASGSQSHTVYLYGYDLSLNSSKFVSYVTLPNDNNVMILARDLVNSGEDEDEMMEAPSGALDGPNDPGVEATPSPLLSPSPVTTNIARPIPSSISSPLIVGGFVSAPVVVGIAPLGDTPASDSQPTVPMVGGPNPFAAATPIVFGRKHPTRRGWDVVS